MTENQKNISTEQHSVYQRNKNYTMSNHIRNLIKQGENLHLDFKYCITDSRKIARSMAAFANTDGGKLLIGVKDNGNIAGVRTDEEYYMIEAAANYYSKPVITFNTTVWEFEKKTVLEITVPKGSEKPYLSQNDDYSWSVYIRVNDQNLLANSVLLRVWEHQKLQTESKIRYTEREKILLDYLKTHDHITAEDFSRIAFITEKTAENILVVLILLDIIEIVFTEKQVIYRLKNSKNHEKNN